MPLLVRGSVARSMLAACAAVASACGPAASTPQVLRPRAEAEAARQRGDAARAQAELAGGRVEERQRDEVAEAQRARGEADRRGDIARHSLALLTRNAPAVLNYAYPLALGRLKPQGAELVGVGKEAGGYVATIRLNYANLLSQLHHLEIAFEYDEIGGYRGWRIVHHSDVLAPRELTIETLMDLAKK